MQINKLFLLYVLTCTNFICLPGQFKINMKKVGCGVTNLTLATIASAYARTNNFIEDNDLPGEWQSEKRAMAHEAAHAVLAAKLNTGNDIDTVIIVYEGHKTQSKIVGGEVRFRIPQHELDEMKAQFMQKASIKGFNLENISIEAKKAIRLRQTRLSQNQLENVIQVAFAGAIQDQIQPENHLYRRNFMEHELGLPLTPTLSLEEEFVTSINKHHGYNGDRIMINETMSQIASKRTIPYLSHQECNSILVRTYTNAKKLVLASQPEIQALVKTLEEAETQPFHIENTTYLEKSLNKLKKTTYKQKAISGAKVKEIIAELQSKK